MVGEGYSFSSLDFFVRAVEVKGDYAYLLDFYHLIIVDVSNPLAPVKLGETERLGVVYDVEVSGNYAYVATSDSGIQIVDVSDPLHPQVVGRTSRYSGQKTRGVTIEESILVEGYNSYIAGYGYVVSGGVCIYDVTDPIHPVEIGSILHAGFDDIAKSVVAIAGDYVYGAIFMDSILEIIPIDDPSAHIIFHDWPDGIRFEPKNVVAFDHHLYVSGSVDDTGPLIAIFDISDPVAPVWVNSFGGAVENMVIDDEKLYIGHGATIDVYDLADPADPNLMLSYNIGQTIEDIDAQDNCVYAGTFFIDHHVIRTNFDVFCTSDPVVTLTPSPTASVEQKFYLPLIHGTAS